MLNPGCILELHHNLIITPVPFVSMIHLHHTCPFYALNPCYPHQTSSTPTTIFTSGKKIALLYAQNKSMANLPFHVGRGHCPSVYSELYFILKALSSSKVPD